MHWRVKAAIQTAVAALPAGLAYPVYYRLQRHVGGLRQVNSVPHLQRAALLVRLLRAHGLDIAGRTCLEVGTGHSLGVPIGLWLAGAGRTITVDLNPYLREALVVAAVDYVGTHEAEVREALGSLATTPTFAVRFAKLAAAPRRLSALLATLDVDYRAPADAAALELPNASLDVHYSTNVLEHVPPMVLRAIFLEAGRVLRPTGLVVHHIDLADHYAKEDPGITAVNFLRFPEWTWARWAGNRFAYHNRLRADDFTALFETVGLQSLTLETHVDAEALAALRAGLPVDARFAGRPPEALAVTELTVVGRFHGRSRTSGLGIPPTGP